MRPLTVIALVALGAVAGCSTSETQRLDGITYGVGNALAANTAMQMVDPWQYGVQDTDLDVPADRAGATAVSANAASSGDSDSSSTDGGTKTTGSSD